MGKYTKGPWEVQKAEDCTGRKLDDLVQWVVTGEDGDLWISTGPTWDPEHAEESESNARLIAAAPELLDALIRARQALAWACEYKSVFQDEYDLVDAAIAKATGESA